MSKRAFQLLLVALLLTGSLWAANDPFVGKWKLNPSQSKLTDQMRVSSAGGNKYAFDFGGGSAETVAADGTDQPVNFGTTLSVTIEGPLAWKVVRKKEGRMLLTATWNLSEDGKTLTDHYTEYRPDGTPLSVDYVYKRTEGTSGFAGTWESTSEQVNSAFEIEVRPYETRGLSLINPAEGVTKSLNFDGKDYPNVGTDVAPGSASSGRRVNEGTLEVIDKMQGKVTGSQQVKLSPDRKTMTMTVHVAGRRTPNILVFERE